MTQRRCDRCVFFRDVSYRNLTEGGWPYILGRCARNKREALFPNTHFECDDGFVPTPTQFLANTLEERLRQYDRRDKPAPHMTQPTTTTVAEETVPDHDPSHDGEPQDDHGKPLEDNSSPVYALPNRNKNGKYDHLLPDLKKTEVGGSIRVEVDSKKAGWRVSSYLRRLTAIAGWWGPYANRYKDYAMRPPYRTTTYQGEDGHWYVRILRITPGRRKEAK